MRRRQISVIFVLAPVAALLCTAVVAVRAQNAPIERSFSQPAEQVRKAVQDLHASSSGHLPTMEGFVDDQKLAGTSLDRYERGFYQCVVEVIPAAKGGVVVRVSAKITAWYAAQDSTKAGYKTLVSNGRLESDYLDRLEQVLGGAATDAVKGATSDGPGSSAPAAKPVASRPHSASAAAGKSAKPAASGSTSAAGTGGTGATGSASNAENSTLDTTTLKQRREASERKMQELSASLRSLQEIQQNQGHPNDLAVVNRDDTIVFARPDANADILMRAHEHDEFQVLSAESQWVHVQISGASRGWIRRNTLEMPPGFEPATRTISTAPPAVEPFRVSREETGSFPGNWKPLSGKTVRIVWVAPTGSSSAGEKRAFAKSVLIARAQSVTDATGISGVVVIFDSADGGQIAATLDDIKKLNDGALHEDAFWRACSLDPPESFQQTSPNGMPE